MSKITEAKTALLTPYDLGQRGEPKVWSLLSRGALNKLDMTELHDQMDRYGKVDFEDDEGTSIVTVWVERNEQGYPILHVQPLGGDIGMMVHP